MTIQSDLLAKLPSNLAGIGLDLLAIEALIAAALVTPDSNGSGFNLILGTPGNDWLTGTSGVDVIIGFAGNDTLSGSRGNDVLLGGDGNDLLLGEAGNDQINGGDGNDRIDGGAGDDTIRAGAGKDRIFGSAGNDNVRGDEGRDILDYGQWSEGITLAYKASSQTVIRTDLPPETPERFLQGLAGTGQIVVKKSETDVDTLTDIVAGGVFGDSGVISLSLDVEDIRGAVGKINTIDFSATSKALYTSLDNVRNEVQVRSAPILVNLAESSLIIGRQLTTVRNFVNVKGTVGSDSLIGDNQANLLTAGDSLTAERDILVGNGGNDRLIANLTGRTTMTGGMGADDFILTSVPDQFVGVEFPGVIFGSNIITDFVSGQDRIVLSRSTTTPRPIGADQLVFGSTPVEGRYVYDPSNGNFFGRKRVDPAAPLAVIQGAPLLKASDIFL
jgi:Ca2+-binding RTX toxin-like protein